jgi:hypothetical protein
MCTQEERGRGRTEWGSSARQVCKLTGKTPLPRESRVNHFGGATPFGGASAEVPAGQHDRDCSPQVPPTTATPAVIHAGEYLRMIRTHSSLEGPTGHMEAPFHPESHFTCVLGCVMRGSRQEPATLLLSRNRNDGQATGMVTLKERWVCGRVNRMGKAGRTSEAMATRTSQYPLAHSDSVRRSRRSLARMDSLSSVVGSARRAGRGAGWLDLLPIRIRFFPGVTSFIVFKILRLLCSGNLCQDFSVLGARDEV